ncbi:MAG: M50 family metallopeptidase [Acidimicrobiia bacterium]
MRDPLDEGSTSRVADGRRAATKAAIVAAGIVVLVIARPRLAGTIGVMFGIVLMIMLHELGHFVMAKRAGMKVTEFFLGFGPRVWSTQRGETEYGVKAIPAGGYVRIIGMNNLEEVDPADEQRTYRSKPYRHRLGVAVAGSTMHFILAFLLLFTVYAAVGLPDSRPVINQIAQGSPADRADFQVGDEVVAINGERIDTGEDLSRYVESHGESNLVFTVRRDGGEIDVPATPQFAGDGDEKVARIGVYLQGYLNTEPVHTAFANAAVDVPRFGWETIKALGGIFSPSGIENTTDLLSGDGGDDNGRFLSPVGATRFAADAVDSGWGAVLMFLFAINLFVGIFNMVPLLPLDGGHVAIATYEKVASKVTGRRVTADVRKLLPVTVAVVALLLVIGVTALYLDIVDPIRSQ